MSRTTIEDNKRLQIRISTANKARISRAAAMQGMDMTQFVTQSALREADAVIERYERIEVSERAFARILELLDNPPEPNAKLKAAIDALPDNL